LPVYYRKLPGNISDVSTVKKSLGLVQTVLDEVRESMLSRASYDSVLKINYHPRSVDWPYRETKKRSGKAETGERRLYLHLYYNGQKAFDDKDAFNSLLDSLEEELRSGKRNPEHEKLYRKYYEVTTTPVRGVSIIPRQDAIDLAERDYGYFALMYLSYITAAMNEKGMFKDYTSLGVAVPA
jgi:hypothetical protein